MDSVIGYGLKLTKNSSEQDYAQQNLNAEKAELDAAIAMSKAHEQEMMKLMSEEERMFMEAIRLSQLSFEAERAE